MNEKLKVSIITASYNSENVIKDCIVSVLEQSYNNIEHIFVDGSSDTDTSDIINDLVPGADLISEPDSGIYDAFNKGLSRATGDIIFFLNSDDRLTSRDAVAFAVETIETSNVDCLFTSVTISSPKARIVRRYEALPLSVKNLEMGLMPPHTGAFVKKTIFDQVGGFKTNFEICGDYDWFCRVAKIDGLSQWVDKKKYTVKMASGGASSRSLRARWILHKEIVKSLRDNQLTVSQFHLLTRYIRKILDFSYMRKART
ncbi:glycosyltransferase [Alphaproteobacteria bacterium]|nr:glycosyltransferase [Alphaproteobacteria bacterium]